MLERVLLELQAIELEAGIEKHVRDVCGGATRVVACESDEEPSTVFTNARDVRAQP